MLTWNGKHVLVDPAPVSDAGDPTVAYRAFPKPDEIVITHVHGDHFNVPIIEAVVGKDTVIVAPREVYDALPAALKAKTKVMKYGDKDVVGAIPVEAVPAYNTTPERTKFHAKGAGNGYILTFGGKRVYIAGDTEEAPELAHLARIDAAFLPMNLPYTETVEAAAKWVKDFKPGVVYPYHCRNADGTMSDLGAFKAQVGGASEVRVLDWY
jgi:L-ascorbate metabolism protein UlaG (beta-lactamase superfamily)